MRRFSIACIVAIAAVGGASAAGAQEPLKIGMITTLSGPAGYIGKDIRDAFNLVVSMHGGKLGGVPVKALVEDDNQKPGNGRQIADRMLKDEHIKLFTGIRRIINPSSPP